MKFLRILILFLCFSAQGYSQIKKINLFEKQATNMRDSINYINALNRKGLLFYEKNIDSAFKYTIKARELAKKINYTKGIADATNTMGVVYDMKGDLQLSLKYYSDAYNDYKLIKDQLGVVQTMMRIGLVYNENGEDKKAINNFKRALTLEKTLKKDSIISLVLANYLLLYADKIPADTIPVYLNKARQIALKFHDARLLILTEQIQAQQYIKKGDVRKGIDILKQASLKAAGLDQNYLNLDILINLGDVLINKDFENGIYYYKKGLNICEQKGYRIYTKVLAKKLFDAYTSKHDIENAQLYSSKLIHVYEEEEKLNNMSGVDYIDYALKDQEVKIITQSSEYRKNIITILSVLFTAVALIGLIIYRLLRLKQKHSATLEELNKVMKSKNEELEVNHTFNNRLISILAHDFRQPIGVLKTLAYLLKDNNLSQEELKQLVDSMEASSNISLEIFENILEWIKRQLSGFSYSAQPLVLRDIIDEAITPFKPTIAKYNLSIVNNIEPDTIIYGDEQLLQFIHRNFLHNAIKFSPEHTTITISSDLKDDEIIVSVKDEGKGISKEKIQSLFNFKKDLKYDNEKEKGAGVALMICKDFILRMSGKIWAENGPNNGAIFLYSLPLN